VRKHSEHVVTKVGEKRDGPYQLSEAYILVFFFFIKQYLGERINIPNDCFVSDIMCLYIVLNLHWKGFGI